MPWADLTDARLYYELSGSGEPIVFIPGLGTTCRLWDSIAPQLAQDFSCILFDNRGVGKSVTKRQPNRLDDFSSDIVELLDTLQVERTHVVGLSLGGVVAQQLAIDHPGRVNKLVLISCANRFGPYLRQVATLLGLTLRRFPFKFFVEMLELLGTAPEYYDSHVKEIEKRIAERVAIDSGSNAAVLRQMHCLGTVDFGDQFKIFAPTLVISGEFDSLIPSCYGRQMANEIPGSRFVLLPRCGHNPPAEQPETVGSLIADFLKRDRESRMSALESARTRVPGSEPEALAATLTGG